MAQALGTQARLALQRETTFGTTPSTPDPRQLYFLSETLEEKVALLSSAVLRGHRNPARPLRGNRDVTGGVKTELSPQMGPLLGGLLGTRETTGASTPYTHNLKVGALPSFTLEKGFLDLGRYILFNGLKVSKMVLNVKPEGSQTVEFQFVGAGEAQVLAYDGQTANFTGGDLVTGGTSGATGRILADSDAGTSGKLTLVDVTGVFQNDEALTDQHSGAALVNGTLGSSPLAATVNDPGHTPFAGTDLATIQEGGVDIATVTQIDLTIENNLDGKSYPLGGGGRRGSVPEGLVKVSGVLTALFDGISLYDKAVRGSESSLKIVYRLGTGVGTAGNEYLEILVPELLYQKDTPVIEGPQGILFKGSFEAYYQDSSQASTVQMVLKNAEATL